MSEQPSICGDAGTLQCKDNGFVMSRDKCDYQEYFKCQPGGVSDTGDAIAGLDNPIRECMKARCLQANLDVENGEKRDPRAYVEHGDSVLAQCNAGYRARASSPASPVLCSDSHDSHDITCGNSSLGQPGYSPCAWSEAVQCLPVMCLVPAILNGVYIVSPVSPGLVKFPNNSYIQYGAALTVYCNTGFRLTLDSIVSMKASSQERVVTYNCDENCTSMEYKCVPIQCKNFTIPNGTMGIKSTDSMNLPAGYVVRDLLYGQNLTVSCIADHRLASEEASCGHRSFTVRCRDDGDFEYASEKPSSALLEEQTCVPIRCNVSSIDTPNAMPTPSSGTVGAGDTVSFTCKEHHHIKPTGYFGKHPLCSHAASFDLTCNGAICDVPSAPVCARKGCVGLAPYLTTDGLRKITFEQDGAAIDPDVDGQLMHNESIMVRCPEGYRVSTSSPADAGLPRGARAICGSDCSIARVECSRLMCGSFTIPAHAVGTRENISGIAAGAVLSDLLYGETLLIECDGNYRLGAADMKCSERSFRVRCSEDGELEYVGSTSSAVVPEGQTCVPIKCDVGAADSRFGVAVFRGKTYPNGTASISDFKANVGETLEVNCWEGYHVTRRDFLSPFSLCDDPKFYSVTCDARYVSPYS